MLHIYLKYASYWLHIWSKYGYEGDLTTLVYIKTYVWSAPWWAGWAVSAGLATRKICRCPLPRPRGTDTPPGGNINNTCTTKDWTFVVWISASKSSIRMFVITEKAPTRAFFWLKAASTAFTFKTLLRHYAKQALTPRPPWLVSIVSYSCPSHMIIASRTQFHIERPWGQCLFSIVS